MKRRTNNRCLFFSRSALLALGVVCLLAAHPAAQDAAQETAARKRAIAYPDLPGALSSWLAQEGVRADAFAATVASIDRATEARELQGEYDHLIFFLLQSTRFTARPPIEPAQSAYEFVRQFDGDARARFLHGGPVPNAKLPAAVNARIDAFLRALPANGREDADERLAYFARLLARADADGIARPARLRAEYARAMKFLYQKEFASREVRPADLGAFVASLYQERGHSTDTQIEANFAVYTALAALRAESPALRLNRVLIVGPGLDFAPRTDLIDAFGPQSYQPFAVADALLTLGLADARLRIDCVDINDRVVAHLQGLRRRTEVRLSLLSGIRDSAARPLTEDFKAYFRAFGKGIGDEGPLDPPPRFAGHLGKSLRVRPEIARAIHAERLNIITERYADAPGYDLVVVTNVFPYFSAPELLFALANLGAMMAEGGYLLHNEFQRVPAAFLEPLGLPIQQARTVMIAADETAPLYDGVVLHRKAHSFSKP